MAVTTGTTELSVDQDALCPWTNTTKAVPTLRRYSLTSKLTQVGLYIDGPVHVQSCPAFSELGSPDCRQNRQAAASGSGGGAVEAGGGEGRGWFFLFFFFFYISLVIVL
jgi:hypothetical protein